MNVTIYTDAAFDHELRAGAWGAWCRSERGRVKGAALCAPGAVSSTHAELQAGVEGVRLAKATWPDMTAALVVTDCEGVMVHLERGATRSNDRFVHEMRRALDAEASAVPLGATFHGGGLHDRPIWDAYAFAGAAIRRLTGRGPR